MAPWLRVAMGLGVCVCLAAPPSTQSDALAERVLRLVNQYRRSQHLSDLRYSTDIARVAREHSREMAAGRVGFGHAGFDARADTIKQWVAFSSVAENVAWNDYPASATADTAVSGWIRSRRHRENIEGDYDETGVGVAGNGRGAFYYTQMFLKRATRAR